mmetsp:Transcript_33633/g.78606  ORF Transcript_33633/g.78606 Transcript_33633/m.78606 type:complete len:245 (-) Transcript_33633:3200-3934(-)
MTLTWRTGMPASTLQATECTYPQGNWITLGAVATLGALESSSSAGLCRRIPCLTTSRSTPKMQARSHSMPSFHTLRRLCVRCLAALVWSSRCVRCRSSPGAAVAPWKDTGHHHGACQMERSVLSWCMGSRAGKQAMLSSSSRTTTWLLLLPIMVMRALEMSFGDSSYHLHAPSRLSTGGSRMHSWSMLMQCACHFRTTAMVAIAATQATQRMVHPATFRPMSSPRWRAALLQQRCRRHCTCCSA